MLITMQRERQEPVLSATRLNAMRAGYLLMGVGLAVVKWPLLPQAHSMPVYEGVTLCLLVALGLLALIGVRQPVRLLPLLVFESTWKIVWLAVVVVPQLISGTVDDATARIAVDCSLVVITVAVTPWLYVWRTLIAAPAELWRAGSHS